MVKRSCPKQCYGQTPVVLVTSRAASKLVPNRRLFGDSFDQPGSFKSLCNQAISVPRKRLGREIALARITWMLKSKRCSPSRVSRLSTLFGCRYAALRGLQNTYAPQQPIFRPSQLKLFQESVLICVSPMNRSLSTRLFHICTFS